MTKPILPGRQAICDTAGEAVELLHQLYEQQIAHLRRALNDFVDGKLNHDQSRVRAHYPYVKITTTEFAGVDSRLSYGYVSMPGVYSTTLTRPDLFTDYYAEQLGLLIDNHGVGVEVGISTTPIPIHFALGEEFHVEGDLTQERIAALPNRFDLPDLSILDDTIVNGQRIGGMAGPKPLSMFTAPRVDMSLQRLRHYTATNPAHFQNHVIYTNYQFYVDEFTRIARDLLKNPDNGYHGLVLPGNRVYHAPHIDENDRINGTDANVGEIDRLPQMPAYHLVGPDQCGITLINIGVGPSNAKTISDHVAVLRPNAWIMLGHCAGLRGSQSLGDYVLAHGYVREDHVLDHDLPTWVPLPPLAEIQIALEQAVSNITGLSGHDRKKVMRTGTVATVDDRNWELRDYQSPVRKLNLSRAIGLDMESGTIAANGYRFRIPYGTLLCISDKPLHGQLKLPGMADEFYRQQVDQHLKIGLESMRIVRDTPPARLHSRKLRSFNEVAFR
jgi:AMP nucleosidase